jgi:hypothetical protein
VAQEVEFRRSYLTRHGGMSGIPGIRGCTKGKIVVQDGLDIKQEPIPKITRAKKTQVIEYLPSKHKAQYHHQKKKNGPQKNSNLSDT